MTAFNAATDLPTQIVTLEQLAAWVALALTSVNPSLTAVEGAGYSERTCQSSIYYIAADNRYRMLSRLSIPIAATHLGGGAKPWMFAQEFSTVALGAAFKTN